MFRVVEYPVDLTDYSVTRDEAEEISEYDPNFKPCIVVTTAREALDAAWELAHPVPVGATIPAENPFIARGPEGITFIDKGYNFTTRVNGLGETEIRTLTQLPEPEPEPWELTRFCYANGVIYKRLQNDNATYWVRGGDVDSYSREDLMKRNPKPVTIEGDEE